MLFSLGLAVLFSGLEFVAGALIGIAVARIAHRDRGGLIRAAAAAGLTFVLLAALSNWAGAHESFFNGVPLDTGPAGENFWLRNRLSEYGLILSVVSSVAVALIVGWVGKRGRS